MGSEYIASIKYMGAEGLNASPELNLHDPVLHLQWHLLWNPVPLQWRDGIASSSTPPAGRRLEEEEVAREGLRSSQHICLKSAVIKIAVQWYLSLVSLSDQMNVTAKRGSLPT